MSDLFIDKDDEARSEDESQFWLEHTHIAVRFTEIKEVRLSADVYQQSMSRALRQPWPWLGQFANLLECALRLLGRFFLSIPVIHFFIVAVSASLAPARPTNDEIAAVLFSPGTLEIAIILFFIVEFCFFMSLLLTIASTKPTGRHFTGFRNMFKVWIEKDLVKQYAELKNAQILGISDEYEFVEKPAQLKEFRSSTTKSKT